MNKLDDILKAESFLIEKAPKHLYNSKKTVWQIHRPKSVLENFKIRLKGEISKDTKSWLNQSISILENSKAEDLFQATCEQNNSHYGFLFNLSTKQIAMHKSDCSESR